MLSSRLRKSGLTEILFFVVNVSPYFPRKIDTTEDDIEREAWLGVSPDEIAGFAKMNKTLDSLARIMDADIKLIQDNEELGIWKLLGGSRDQVLVIDRYVNRSHFISSQPPHFLSSESRFLREN